MSALCQKRTLLVTRTGLSASIQSSRHSCSFDPKQGLSLSRLTRFFGVIWIAGVHQHRDQFSAGYDLLDKLDLFGDETVRHADDARKIAARLLKSGDKPNRIGLALDEKIGGARFLNNERKVGL
jgi:hypothetical protein